MDIESLANVQDVDPTLRRIQHDLAGLVAEKEAIEEEISELHRELNHLKSEINVSDHAVLRFIERRFGRDLDDVRAYIVNKLDVASFSVLGNNGSYPIGEGLRAVMRNNTVVTIVQDK